MNRVAPHNDVPGVFEAEPSSGDDADVLTELMQPNCGMVSKPSQTGTRVGAGRTIIENNPLEAGAGILSKHRCSKRLEVKPDPYSTRA